MSQQTIFQSLRHMRIGLIFVFITLLYGFILGGIFGAFEVNVKSHLTTSAEQVIDEKYDGNITKARKVLEKSWTYIKRSHIHANGLGTASLAIITFLSLCPLGSGVLFTTSLFLGVGSLGYSLFWLFAGLLAPGLGSTGEAKEALTLLAVPSSGLCIIGLAIAALCCVYALYRK